MESNIQELSMRLALPAIIALSAVATAQVTVSPRRAPVTLHQTQQFTANIPVNWLVDGIVGGNSTVGTISTGGLYTPPAKPGTHTVTAQSKNNSTQKANARVWVTNYPGMLTWHGDKYRSGVNSQELALSPRTVNEATFGKLFSFAVDGQLYAQPLHVSNLKIGGVARNVLFVATEHDSVYAFDADGHKTAPLWKRSFLTSSSVTTLHKPSNGLISPEVGITSTPVIDQASQTIYVAALTVDGGKPVHRLHALSLTTGAEKFGGPVIISGSYKGATFAASRHLQRASLLLLNGVVFIAYTSYGDATPYQGWLFAYTAKGTGKLHQAGAFSAGPTKGEASIWMSGAGPAADDNGDLYFLTGNGAFDLNTGGSNAGNTLLRLHYANGGFTIADYFTPFNQSFLDSQDFDLGSGGPFMPASQPGSPTPHLVLGGSKEGMVYVVNRDNMGKFHSNFDADVQTLDLTQPGTFRGVFSTPAGWRNWVYIGAVNAPLEAFQFFSNGKLPNTPSVSSPQTFAYPGTTPMVSANGSSNGIVWALDNSKYFGGSPSGKVNSPGPAVLHAYNASNISQELWNSAQAGSRDTCGTAIKFTVPTIANGHVYVGGANTVTVYGLLP
jgi:hypothetical protein